MQLVKSNRAVDNDLLKGPGKASAHPQSFWGPPAFVWGIWTLLMLASLALIARYHSYIPFGEDWGNFVGRLTGEDPVNLTWLWSQEGEHRIFLGKFLGWALLTLGRGDYWAISLFSLAVLGGLALAMIRVAKHLRGWTSYADAIFPLALLHWEFSVEPNYANPMVVYGLSAFAAGPILAVIAARGMRLTFGSGLVAGLCLVLLPLCGAAGLLYVPALGLWLACSVVLALWSPGDIRRWQALVVAGFGFATLFLLYLYFAHYQRGVYAPPATSLRNTVTVGLAALTYSFGSAGAQLWPYSGWLLAFLLVLSAAILLVVICRDRGIDRSRAWGLLFFLGALGMLALALGWGRGGKGTSYAFTYYLLPTLVLPCVYFISGLYRPRTVGSLVQTCLFTLVVVAVTLDVEQGYPTIQSHHTVIETCEQDMRNQLPSYAIIARNYSLLSGDYGEMLGYFKLLRRAKIGAFQSIPEEPALTEVPVELNPVELHEVTWDGSLAHGTGGDSFLTFALPEPRFVAVIHLHVTTPSVVEGGQFFQVGWRKSGEADFPGPQYWSGSYVAEDVMICVGDTIDRIRIYPDQKPFDFGLASITLLVPETEPAAEAK